MEDKDSKQKILFEKMMKESQELDVSGVRAQSCLLGRLKEIMVPMRDGVKLRTIAYFPAGEGPWPVIFTRTPYPMEEKLQKREAEEYAQRGYVYIIQFCRGTGGSEGRWIPNENERNDGIDGINWVAGQEWCKSIGIHGGSYAALTGWIIADQLPDKVKTLYLWHYSVDRYLSAYKAGLFRHDILTAWTMGNMGKGENGTLPDHIESSLYRPHINVDTDLWGVRLDWYRQWITNVEYHDAYWQKGVWKTLREIPEKIRIPVCVIAGWFDHHLEGTILGYEKLNELTKAQSKLIIGGWNHGMIPCVPAHNPKNAAINKFAHKFEWFDRILVGGIKPDTGAETYIIGEDIWRKWESWPLQSTSSKHFYLTAEEGHNSNCHALSVDQSADPGILEYDYDPENPVYSYGGETLFGSFDKIGSLKQQEPGYRPDVISFVSEPLAEDILIAGKINVRLYVSSDCYDTCFTAKIMEVLPSGDAYNMRSGITTLAYRNNSPSRLAYSPGGIVEINIGMLPVTWKMKAGSSVRVDISSSNFPEYSIHSNYPGVWSLQEKTRIAHQKLYCGEAYPSCVVFPFAKE